jgi:DNA repair photolyase
MDLKKSTGNMYPWVTHTHTHLGGECPHKCAYCYVNNPRFGRPEKYTGELRLIEPEFRVNYGSGKTIFIENCNDLFAVEVPQAWISRVLEHCRQWPENTYVIQTKNPARLEAYIGELPPHVLIGTTLETNRWFPHTMQNAPAPIDRVLGMIRFRKLHGSRPFITIEPILLFDEHELINMLLVICPLFVNIGADSKGKGLPEPTGVQVRSLLETLKRLRFEVREKHNLERIFGEV